MAIVTIATNAHDPMNIINIYSGLITVISTIQLTMQAILRLSSANKYRAKSSADIVYSLQLPNRVLYLWTLNNRTLRTSYVQQLNNSCTIVRECDSAHIERPCKFIERSSLEAKMSSKGRKLIAKVDKSSRRKKDRLLNNVCMIDIKRDE